MSAQPVEPGDPAITYQQLQDLAEAFEAEADRRGERVRADIANEEITVHMMSPSPGHSKIVKRILRQIEEQDETAEGYPEVRIEHPDLGLCRSADLAFTLEGDAFDDHDGRFALFAPDVTVAFEVVSPSNPGNDYITKLRDYPRMGVPAYVIIDPRDGTVTVHSGPDTVSGEPCYREAPRKYKFGDTVQLGTWTLDTSKFPKY
jgi:Uma2 family endonuclease